MKKHLLSTLAFCSYLVLSSGADRPLGANLGGSDPVMPRPAGGRNLIENPSFEGGMTYWGIDDTPPTNPDPTGRCGWRLVEGEAHSGRHCMEYTSVKGFNAPMLTSYPLILKIGVNYTMSFYAKADPSGARSTIRWMAHDHRSFHGSATFRPGKEWQRFTFKFKMTTTHAQFYIGDLPGGDARVPFAKIYIDDVQFEEGESETEFVQKPIFAHFENNARSGVYFTGESAPVKLLVANTTEQSAPVTGKLNILDVNGRIIGSKPVSMTVKPYDSGEMSFDVSTLKIKGLLRLVAELKAGSFSDTFFGRVMVCEDLTKRQLTVKYLCHRPVGPTLDEVSWMERLGYRGSLGFEPAQSAALYRDYEKIGWKHIFTVVEGEGAPVKVFEQANMTEADWAKYLTWIDERLKPYAGLPVWYKTMNEPDIPRRAVWTPADHVRIVKHIRETVKKTAPDALILTPDPYHSGFEAQAWLDRFFAAGGKDVVDALAIHTYRARAEDPDLDGDIQAIKALKAKYGISKIPTLFTEGEGIPLYTIDSIGMSPLKGCFLWRLGSLLSLDVGPSEATAAASMVRRLLPAFKNADDVKSYLNWGSDFGKQDGQPLAPIAAINNLYSLLGDATFARELVIGDNVKTYLFKTPKGSPTAVLWGYDMKMERGEVPAPKASLALPSSGWKILDMMGNPLEVTRHDGRIEFPLGNQPVYVVGDTISLDDLNLALEKSSVGGGGLKTVDMTLRLSSLAEATVRIGNRLPRDMMGTLTATLDGKTIFTGEVQLKAKASQEVAVPLPGKRNALNTAQIQLAFKEKATGSVSSSVNTLRWFAITPLSKTPSFTGNSADWAEASTFVLDKAESVKEWVPGWKGLDDCSATWRFGYTPQGGLFICAEVRDDVLVQQSAIKKAWLGDSIQLYLDLRADGHDKPGAGYDTNDETIWAAKIAGKDVLYRDYTPEWQVAFVHGGVINEGKVVITRKGDVTFYEIQLPPNEASPLAMKPGTAFGLGLTANDADVESVRRQSITNTPQGTEPHSNPDLWPHAVLTDK